MNRTDFKLVYKDNSLTNDQWEQKWLKMRIGRFTASQAYRLLSDDKRSGWRGYVREIVAEMITGDSDFYTNAYMEHGKQFEPEALTCFMEKNNCVLRQKTFAMIGDHIGASADGLWLENRSGVEAKCGLFKTHLAYLGLKVPSDLETLKKAYYVQCQWAMLVLGFDNWHFITYYPPRYLDKPVKHYGQLLIPKDERMQEELKEKLKKAIEYKNELLEQIKP